MEEKASKRTVFYRSIIRKDAKQEIVKAAQAVIDARESNGENATESAVTLEMKRQLRRLKKWFGLL